MIPNSYLNIPDIIKKCEIDRTSNDICLELHPADMHSYKISSDYNPKTNRYFQWIVYTDGSKQECGVGAGVCIQNNSNKTIYQARSKLAKHYSIVQAELWATYKAITQIKDNLNKYKGNIKFLIDSKVVLHVLAKTENITLLGKEVIKVAQYLSTTRNIQFSWIPTHKGHKGNELADSLAKMASTLKTQGTQGTYTRLPKSTLKNSLNEWTLIEWQEDWNNSTMGRLCHQFIPPITNRIKANYYKPRSETTQCLTGHGNFMAYLYCFKKRNANKCRCDNNSIGDALHFIFHYE
ncbi:uncharacterized protein [Centruroides vittatus]|uniref:uncharacterized protein n=1 Tax=Centruroides vittatus TaxID=120091 RepID=UPI00350EC8B5